MGFSKLLLSTIVVLVGLLSTSNVNVRVNAVSVRDVNGNWRSLSGMKRSGPGEPIKIPLTSHNDKSYTVCVFLSPSPSLHPSSNRFCFCFCLFFKDPSNDGHPIPNYRNGTLDQPKPHRSRKPRHPRCSWIVRTVLPLNSKNHTLLSLSAHHDTN
jgi:hypothetical protein